ncbi:Ger(x)C family spore germination protein [Fictibacillus sp. 18YEL24]|uniref:Ger(x)C family spore germination protein n=1 Tax=Fictibacillus sp. 18YEL24 TaxID=2745875 RepID=UPI0018CD600D|nr:Ger(x)C family spore germination protein [Fictibacillus sp. 18YEL24]MBH0171472.1 Ger(x)C family spore germination protein [Fictibacillus sp. 18YEL24]
MRKHIYQIMIILTSTLILSGCFGYKEMNNLAFVIGIGIDKKDEATYRVTFQVVHPNEIPSPSNPAGGQSLPIINYVGEGHTISEAARNTSKQISRQSYYGHIGLLIISEEAAKDNLLKVLDVFERDAKARLGTPILIAHKSSANHVLGALSPLQKMPSIADLEKLENTTELLGENMKISVNEVIQTISNPGSDVFISGIHVPKKDYDVKDFEKPQPLVPNISGVALFRGDKMVHWVEARKTRALTLAKNKLQLTNLSIKCINDKKNYISIALFDMKTKQDVTMKNGIPHITFSIKGKGDLDEVMCDTKLTKDYINQTKRMASEILEKEFIDMFNTATKKKVDVFSSGYELYKDNPNEWKRYKKDWRILLREAEVEVNVKLNIMSSGMRSDTAQITHD